MITIYKSINYTPNPGPYLAAGAIADIIDILGLYSAAGSGWL